MRKCKIWTRALNAQGYGVKRVGKQGAVRVSRITLAKKLGRPIKKGMLALHKCNNPACYEPSHLYEGTYRDNMLDYMRASGNNTGERHPMARLTEKQVRRILKLLGKVTYAKLGDRYGVSMSTIGMIANGTNWRHVKHRRK